MYTVRCALRNAPETLLIKERAGVTQGLGRHVWDLLDFSNILSILPTVQKLVLV